MNHWATDLSLQGRPDGLTHLDGVWPDDVLDSAEPLFAPLDHYGMLQASGPQVDEFLQGQLTCDLRELGPDVSLPGAACDLKGRVYTTLLLSRFKDEHRLLRMHRELVAPVIETLQRYAAFSRTQLADASAHWRCVGLLGGAWRERSGDVLPPWPEPGGSSWRDGVCLHAGPDAGDRVECWFEAGQAARLLASLHATGRVVGSDCWQLALIRRRHVDLEPSLAGQFLPQLLNLDGNGAVSFRKGCYTGQEIVARTHYRGQLKRHLYRAECRTGEVPDAMSPVLRADDGKSVGSVVVAVATAPERVDLLAVIADQEAASAALRVGAQDGPALNILG